ncbi:EAL domain-containing protein [Paraburkholderia sp. MMS20-SJTN17]|uniref:EAL domain-containing protein n=1 Tax=Paraburkholderia translucens TaxID=2886945 RepID=A0ABS8KH38_9BURK|nr:EAL domain-containing protein [Paraburkholderia sp. MMS20-SJTN17]MCC8404103.1 EAL domain-containing protein [Paraburkholderia sp. MMS20-SJTN17]
MSAIQSQHLSEPSMRERFHQRSLEHQRPLSVVTMAFTVLTFLCMVVARQLVGTPAASLGYRLPCALVLALLALAIPLAKSARLFGAIGVAYELVLIGGLALNAIGVAHPLAWLLPALVVIPICAAPLWLTPVHFLIGNALFYAAAVALLLGQAHAREVDAVMWTWVIAIGAPTAAVVHFGFYRLRRNHFLLESQLAQLAAIERPDGHAGASLGVAEEERGESLTPLPERAHRAPPFDAFAPRAQGGDSRAGAARYRWEDFHLISHFQPLYSLSHRKQVGFEALLRGEHDDGTLVPPVEMFAPKPSRDEGALDRASHAVHLGNARRALPGDAWLFLNILPATFIGDGYCDQLTKIVRASGLEPERVVLEILESHGGSVDDMSRAAERYRQHGFLIAVDDFGAGQSNLDRLLRIRPDLVKLDGELIRATAHGTEQPILPKLVSLLHQAGMLVVVEGVETAEELILAVQSNVDFAQGYLLGRPSAEIARPESVHRQIDDAFDVIAQGRAQQHALFESEVEPYRLATLRAAEALRAGTVMDDAFALLATFERCISCFILDDIGRQIGHEVRGPAWREDTASLQPVANPRDARWDHRPYFRNAVLQPGKAITSNPYLSLASGRPCIAVTLALQLASGRCVIGVELDWSARGLPWPAGE